ncbi:hypothetical protein DPMN_027519 [Dreissena polymorpha]|uniref:Uncharacterized protein n=1 Tax=Dreissena polymorpha TaxID=45954 RepID=A0A9D4LVC2_DREPO|nr:hypothetical protein DPMN_027519 [Dreissena polymorpha]
MMNVHQVLPQINLDMMNVHQLLSQFNLDMMNVHQLLPQFTGHDECASSVAPVHWT